MMATNITLANLMATNNTSLNADLAVTNDSHAHSDDDANAVENFIVAFLEKYYSLVLLVFGTVGNILCFAVLSRKTFRSATVGIYLRFLTLSDLGALYTGVMYFTAKSLFDLNVRKIDVLSCKFHKWLSFFFCDLSSWALVLMSIARLISIMWPMKRLITKKRIYISILVIIVVLLGANLPMFIIFGDVKDPVHNDTVHKCTYITHAYRDFYEDIFGWLVLLKFALLPAVILIGLNTALVISVTRTGNAISRIESHSMGEDNSTVTNSKRVFPRGKNKNASKNAEKFSMDDYDITDSTITLADTAGSDDRVLRRGTEDRHVGGGRDQKLQGRRGILDKLLSLLRIRRKSQSQRSSTISGDSEDEISNWLCDLRMLVSRGSPASKHHYIRRGENPSGSSPESGQPRNNSKHWKKYYHNSASNSLDKNTLGSEHGDDEAASDVSPVAMTNNCFCHEDEMDKNACADFEFGKSGKAPDETSDLKNSNTNWNRKNSQNRSVFTISSQTNTSFTYNQIAFSDTEGNSKKNNGHWRSGTTVVIGKGMSGAITVGSTPIIAFEAARPPCSAGCCNKLIISTDIQPSLNDVDTDNGDTMTNKSAINTGNGILCNKNFANFADISSMKSCEKTEDKANNNFLVDEDDDNNRQSRQPGTREDNRGLANDNEDRKLDEAEKNKENLKNNDVQVNLQINGHGDRKYNNMKRKSSNEDESPDKTESIMEVDDICVESEAQNSASTHAEANSPSASKNGHSSSTASTSASIPSKASVQTNNTGISSISTVERETAHQNSPKRASSLTPQKKKQSLSKRRRSSVGQLINRGGSSKSKNLTRTLLVINTVFIICNVPITVYFTARAYIWPGEDDERNASRDLFVTIANFTMYTNNSINFILYCVTGSRFRRQLVLMFKELFHKLRSFIRRCHS